MSYANLSFSGEQFMTPGEKKSEKAKLKRYYSACAKAAKKLDDASEAMSEVYLAAFAADLPGVRRESDDARKLLAEEMRGMAWILEAQGRKKA